MTLFLERKIQNIHSEKAEFVFIGRKNSEDINLAFKQKCFQKCTVLESLTESDAVERFRNCWALFLWISWETVSCGSNYQYKSLSWHVSNLWRSLILINCTSKDLTVFCSPHLLSVLPHSTCFRFLPSDIAAISAYLMIRKSFRLKSDSASWRKSQLNVTLSSDDSMSSQRLQPL